MIAVIADAIFAKECGVDAVRKRKSSLPSFVHSAVALILKSLGFGLAAERLNNAPKLRWQRRRDVNRGPRPRSSCGDVVDDLRVKGCALHFFDFSVELSHRHSFKTESPAPISEMMTTNSVNLSVIRRFSSGLAAAMNDRGDSANSTPRAMQAIGRDSGNLFNTKGSHAVMRMTAPNTATRRT